MSKKYGFGVRLAAVALAIAGVLGTAVAAPNFPSGDAVAAFALDNPFVGEIKWANPPKVDGATIGSYNVIPEATDADMVKGNMGNVGVLAIKTNGFHWDVVMRSKYGGRLYADGKDTTVSDKYPSGCDGMLVACKDTIIKKAGTALAYGSSLPTENKTAENLKESIDAGTDGAADLVVLDIAVGAAIKGVSGNFFAVGCTSSGGTVTCETAPLAVRLGKADVTKSGTMIKENRSEGAGANAASGVSFANAIGNNTDAVNKITALTAGTTEYLGLTGTVNAAAIKGGFKGTNVEQYIYVNVGVHPSNSSYINANGTTTYKETFTFTLLNGY